MSRLQSAAGRVPNKLAFSQWPLRRKLAAALVLPVLLALVLGGLRVKSEFDQSTELANASEASKVVKPLIDYNAAVQTLATSAVDGGPARNPSVAAYEKAAAALAQAAKNGNVGPKAKAEVASALANGKGVRTAIEQTGALSVVIDKANSTAQAASAVVADLGLTNDSDSSRTISAIQDTIAAHRSMTAQQLSLENADDAGAVIGTTGQVGAEASFLTRLKNSITPANSVDLQRLTYDNFRRGVTLQAAGAEALDRTFLSTSYRESGPIYSAIVQREMTTLERSLSTRASEHRTTALVNTALVALALLATLLLVLALIRSLLTPIRAVRQGTLDIANNRLPEAVAKIRDGEEAPAFVPIPVTTHEEMGQVARAVDDLHKQALSLAGDQARLRVQVGHMFETLSRRSTSLIDQQLSLIERLESDEEDPKRLQSLFRLDHLAARMRRNSDSLLVLAGTSTRRGVSGSISVSDAVRAAVSEVENYERIDIGETATDHVLGAVGSDLIHLLAEVVDNALAYSSPTTRVAIRGARTPEGGLLVEVADRGLGMPPKDLASLNDQLAHGGDITADTARRMGLFVVGSLAKRHGIAVRLRRNGQEQQGVTVSVHLPAGLLADTATLPERTQRAKPAAAPVAGTASPAGPAPSAVGGVTTAGLPSRVRGASGAPSTPVPGAAKALPTRTPGAHGPGAPVPPVAPSKPVIETSGAPKDVPAPVNGKAADPAGQVNGNSSNGFATQSQDHKAPNGHAAPDADGHAAPDANGHAAPDATVQATAAEDTPGAASAPTPDAVTPVADGAPEPGARSAAGLPVRKPSASRITEYREFEASPEASEPLTSSAPSAKAGAPAAKQSRLTGWLPGRSKAAAAEASAKADSEAGEERPMPSNLSAWLDHRAKMVEATKARHAGGETPVTEAPADNTDNTDTFDTADNAESTDTIDRPDGTVAPVTEVDEFEPQGAESPVAEALVVEALESDVPAAEEDLHVPDEWIAAVTGRGDHLAAEPDATPVEAEAGHPQTGSGTLSRTASESAPEQGGDPEPVARPVAFVDAPGGESAPSLHQRSTALPTRVPGTSGAPTEQADAPTAGRPALRAHSSSFFGARKARDAQPVVEAPVSEAPVVEAPVAEAPVVEGPVAEAPVIEAPFAERSVADAPAELAPATDVEAAEAEQAPAFVEAHVTEVEVVAPIAEAPVEAPIAEVEVVAPIAEAPVEVEQPTAESAASDATVESVESVESVETVETVESVEPVEAVEVTDHAEGAQPAYDHHVAQATDAEVSIEPQPEPATPEVAKARSVSMNETPIFRAMMSRWLTDDADPGAATQWAPTDADEAWSAAARIEAAPPLEESPVGLPQRRPGNYLIPGAIESDASAFAAPAANRRDPEAIRRNLQRHQQGVSSGRTEAHEAHDGNHREEADVHH